MKTAIKVILLLGVAGYIIFAIARFAQPAEEQVCEAVDVQLTDSILSNFITESYVHRILQKNKIYAEGQKVSSLNMQEIEEIIMADPYIEKVTCYCSAANHLCINITPQHPVLHVIAQNGEDYYMDNNGTIMPIGDLNIDLCVATGNITKKSARKDLIALADFIYNDAFWNEQIQQINVLRDNCIEMIPRVGDHTIVLGSSDNYETKLNKLFLFYKEGLPKVGWNKYSRINLAYEGQIVCTKKTTNKTI